MVITSSGTRCDICGNYILLQPVFELSINVISKRLHAHESCYEEMEEWAKGDMRIVNAMDRLPEGPLKEAVKQIYT